MLLLSTPSTNMSFNPSGNVTTNISMTLENTAWLTEHAWVWNRMWIQILAPPLTSHGMYPLSGHDLKNQVLSHTGFCTQYHMSNVDEVQDQGLSCKEQIPDPPWKHTPTSPMCAVWPDVLGNLLRGNPWAVCSVQSRTQQAQAPEPGPRVLSTDLGAGELWGQGSPS